MTKAGILANKICISIPKTLLKEVDWLRHDISRSRWITKAVQEHVEHFKFMELKE